MSLADYSSQYAVPLAIANIYKYITLEILGSFDMNLEIRK